MVKETMDVDVVDVKIVPLPNTDKIDGIPEMVEGQLREANTDTSSKDFEVEGNKDFTESKSTAVEGMATNADGPVQGSEEDGDAGADTAVDKQSKLDAPKGLRSSRKDRAGAGVENFTKAAPQPNCSRRVMNIQNANSV
ncbi:hypothetical protein ACH5RR_016566 [Cinchona calisaya]|uniref:Uncharacterized protein n=1 Tax=Cinchona calisaya TaxID=153742 RepID=A0ABD2ZYZ8_9GENT